MLINFYLRFSTRYGQELYVSGSHTPMGGDDFTRALPLQYFNEEYWFTSVEITGNTTQLLPLTYRYLLRESDGNEVVEWGNDRVISFSKNSPDDITVIDIWNHAGDRENAFFTKPFREVLQPRRKFPAPKAVKSATHEFRVKAPLLGQDEVVCITGSGKALGDWGTDLPFLLRLSGDWWTIRINLNGEHFPVAYKYGIYNTATESFVQFESSGNRILPGDSGRGKLTILHDGFAQFPMKAWRGTGVAIPVFSLRSEKSFGTGEFTDIRLLVDWAKSVGLKMIQLLPVNDTTANHSFTDSYPYAAISAFALHPLYLNMAQVAGKAGAAVAAGWTEKQQQLNALPALDYEEVMRCKWEAIRTLYKIHKDKFTRDAAYLEFYTDNAHWLLPYAAFCCLRDRYHTADFGKWGDFAVYDDARVRQLVLEGGQGFDEAGVHLFVQYHLHLQLRSATEYAHTNGVVVKGDLPIGIYRNSCDAWVAPELYNMDEQAGAPPDDFAVSGQNWGFPTYNWKRMQEDGFAWWRKRFGQMSAYFDAFRIDHILGFFRIWSIPLHSVQGIMGRFVPAIPVQIHELHRAHISFDHSRYCRPYITDQILQERFGALADTVRGRYLQHQDGSWQLRPEFATQRQVEEHFAGLGLSEEHQTLKYGLFDLISNVILFADEEQPLQRFHFRFGMSSTSSFRDLDAETKIRLDRLYVDYFFRRQDAFWQKEAMHKLPGLKRSTEMLVCGEDLGMVPHCVPDVMAQLGVLSLEIQRMPKQSEREFFHPADAPYLSVVTPSTHDMSTIRGWWEEDHAKSQRFYNHELGREGAAPYFCSGQVNEAIVSQHLRSPAMWSIFQLQDLMGMDEGIRHSPPSEERINIPADPRHYWRYRMHLSLEQLQSLKDFNFHLRKMIQESGRA